eukprot:917288_1
MSDRVFKNKKRKRKRKSKPQQVHHQQRNKASKNNQRPRDKEEQITKRCRFYKKMTAKIKPFKIEKCDKCNGNETDWLLCLTCFGMYYHEHDTLDHYANNPKHKLCMVIPSYQDFNQHPKTMIMNTFLVLWCYQCNELHQETTQNKPEKLQKIRCEVYECLQREYKRISHQVQTQNNPDPKARESEEDDLKQNSKDVPSHINGEYFHYPQNVNINRCSDLCGKSMDTKLFVSGNRMIQSQSKHVYEWKFKITQKNPRQNQGPFIGIYATDVSDKLLLYGFGFEFEENRKQSRCIKYTMNRLNGAMHSKSIPVRDSRIKSGTMITMRLDLVRNTLSFTNNYTKTLICIDNIMADPSSYYKLTINLNAKHQCVTLVNYEDNEPKQQNELRLQCALLKRKLHVMSLKQQAAAVQMWNQQKTDTHQFHQQIKTKLTEEVQKADNKMQLLSKENEHLKQLMIDKEKQD